GEHVGVMLDPGNQNFEGYERPELSVGLLGEYLRAVGVKDTAIERDPARSGEEAKGWRRTWATLDEGETNWHALARALHAADFRGHFVWMPFYDELDPAAMTAKLQREVAYLRKVLAEVEGEAESPAR
ncbi:MAG TPA: TIM barrel protein, partial [Phycisphaerae bacterium]|nr:TIM barrel protein [Phycisphaerae bacterium]